ncbi:MAG: outer membrane protein assembly factor BamD [Candidatus Latescibacterota bacterium]|nr:MAG: outer membrane protein assembly factor BamD [Candidatus Latescibacterota bacterium]
MNSNRTQVESPGRIHVARILCVVFAALLVGCAGGVPSIPNDPEEILSKGDQYHKRKKYLQSQALYKAFLTRYPGHDRSDYAQFMVAESYYGDEEYALAAVEYQILVTNYGYSEYVDDGYFKQALCNYKQAPKPHLDQTKTYEALSQLQQFVQVFTRSPILPEAQKYIQKIHERLAKKELSNATFYYDSKRYPSALIYLNKIIDDYPDNSHWVGAMYLKAKILTERGENEDEAIELLRRVMEYPEDLDVKKRADLLLQQLGRG